MSATTTSSSPSSLSTAATTVVTTTTLQQASHHHQQQQQQHEHYQHHSKHTKTIGKNLLAGAMARCGAAIIMFPIDVVKTRLQFQTNQMTQKKIITKYYTSGFNAFTSIIKEEGLRGMYRGLTVRLIYITPAAAVSFTVYESFTHALHNQNKDSFSWKTPAVTLAAGAAARVLGTACRTPFDILKQQLQVDGQLNRPSLRNMGLVNSMKHIVKANGLRGFYAGYGVTLMRDAPFAAIYFTTYDFMKTIVFGGSGVSSTTTATATGDSGEQLQSSVHADPMKHVKHLTSGAVAGFTSTCLTIPVDVVKTRLQTQTKLGEVYYDGIWDAFRKIKREEGWRAFTKGLGPRLSYIMPASALTFTLYESLKSILQYSYEEDS